MKPTTERKIVRAKEKQMNFDEDEPNTQEKEERKKRLKNTQREKKNI